MKPADKDDARTPRPLHRSPHWLTPQPRTVVPSRRRSQVTTRSTLINSPSPRVVTSVAPTSYSSPPLPAVGDYSDVESLDDSQRPSMSGGGQAGGMSGDCCNASDGSDDHGREVGDVNDGCCDARDSDDADTVNGHSHPSTASEWSLQEPVLVDSVHTQRGIPSSSDESLAQSDFKRPVQTHDFWHPSHGKTSSASAPKTVTFAPSEMSTESVYTLPVADSSVPSISTDSYTSAPTLQEGTMTTPSSSDPTTPEERPYEAPFSSSGIPLARPVRRITSATASVDSRSTGSVADRIRGTLFGYRQSKLRHDGAEWLAMKLEWPDLSGYNEPRIIKVNAKGKEVQRSPGGPSLVWYRRLPSGEVDGHRDELGEILYTTTCTHPSYSNAMNRYLSNIQIHIGETTTNPTWEAQSSTGSINSPPLQLKALKKSTWRIHHFSTGFKSTVKEEDATGLGYSFLSPIHNHQIYLVSGPSHSPNISLQSNHGTTFHLAFFDGTNTTLHVHFSLCNKTDTQVDFIVLLFETFMAIKDEAQNAVFARRDERGALRFERVGRVKEAWDRLLSM